MKKVLVIYPTSLLPTKMMSQKRTLAQIHTLSLKHDVSVLSYCNTKKEVQESEKYFANSNINFLHIPISNQKVSKKIRTAFYLILHKLFYRRFAYSKNASKSVINFVSNVANNGFDVVIAHYWYASVFYRKVNQNVYKLIDTHVLVEEDINLNKIGYFYNKNKRYEKRFFKNSLRYQKKIFQSADGLVLNSFSTYEIAKKDYNKLNLFYCPNGQDLEYYYEYKNTTYDPNLILFYGSLGGKQNIDAFQLFYENVWPEVLKKNEKAKLKIVGNRPPKWIQDLDKESNIEVTGFVEDVRPHIASSCCMLIPMNLGIGFRGRVIEVMALGVPVIGNHLALDCIGIENGVTGFVIDDFIEMAKYTLRLMENSHLRKSISSNARAYIDENFSIHATFGKFSEELINL